VLVSAGFQLCQRARDVNFASKLAHASVRSRAANNCTPVRTVCVILLEFLG
jgi:hypothetical protein